MAPRSRPSLWYDAPKEGVAKAAHAHWAAISTQQKEMREAWVTYLEMYAAGDVTGLGRAYSRSYYYAVESAGKPAVRFNLTAAVVDTAHSLISQAPVIPTYQTTDGDFGLSRKAEKASQVLQGQLGPSVREIMKQAQLDALKVGTGFVFPMFDPITGLPGVERVSPLEVFIDHLDGQYGSPRTCHRARPFPREALVAQYPDLEMEIDRAPAVAPSAQTDLVLQGLVGGASFADYVWVLESWHRRPGPKGKGRHVISLPNVALLDEEWNEDVLPPAVFRYRQRHIGFYGAGLIEAVRSNQSRVDRLIARIDRAQDLASNVVILNPSGEGGLSADDLTNEVGLILNYNPGLGAPQVVQWSGNLADLQQQVDVEMQRALTQEGVSPSQTNGQGAGKGLDSGAAVRAADDVQSRRLVDYVGRFQNACLRVAQLFEGMNDQIASTKRNYAPVAEKGGLRRAFLTSSRWRDVRPPKGDARLTMNTMSALPTTPAGRWAAVQQWIQAGFCSRQWSMALLDFPDLDQFASIELAHMELAKYQIEQILDGGAPYPDPRQDLEMTIDVATKSKFRAVVQGAGPEIEQAFEDFIVYCEGELLKAKAPPAPPPGAPMPGPGPMAPPGAGPALPPGAALPTQVVAPGLQG